MKLSPWHFAVEFRTSQGQLQRTRQNPSGDQQVSVNEQKKMRCFGFTTYLGPILDSSSYLIVASTDLELDKPQACPVQNHGQLEADPTRPWHTAFQRLKKIVLQGPSTKISTGPLIEPSNHGQWVNGIFREHSLKLMLG